jgi:UDP-2-acetamido-2-deoxy-ribo-hexuluronate aminotransferase
MSETKEIITPVPMFDPRRHLMAHNEEYQNHIEYVLAHGRFINGPEVGEIEKKLADFVGAKHAIGVSSGTDALLISLMALDVGPGDEVITVPFTWISSAEVICLLRATPIFCDIDKDTFNMDPQSLANAITEKTKVVMPVSMFGQMYDEAGVRKVVKDAEEKFGTKIYVVEDAAQSFGAVSSTGKSCSVGDIGCTSFFPTKPLGCFGDGGMCFTESKELDQKIRKIRNHGCLKRYQYECVGVNGRLDTLQAAILLAKVPTLHLSLEQRSYHAEVYDEAFADNPHVKPPVKSNNCLQHAYAQYTITLEDEKTRDELQVYLKAKQIGCGVFYPVCLHLVPALTTRYQPGSLPVSEDLSKRVLSLPCYPELSEREQRRVIWEVSRFFVDR